MSVSELTGNTTAVDANRASKDAFGKVQANFHGREVTARFAQGVANEGIAVAPPETAFRPKKASYTVCKRALDWLGAGTLLLLSFPFLLIIAILIKATSRGPVLFTQKRPGLNGKAFYCLKFRTMVVDAEEQLKAQSDLSAQLAQYGKIKNDPRVTRIGAFLRKTSLDELPQLLNVFLGDMSLVGPRPILYSQWDQYGVYIDKLLSVKPGLGGLWQVSGRSNVSFDERIRLDMDYVDQCSFWFDLRLLVLTAVFVCLSRGAY